MKPRILTIGALALLGGAAALGVPRTVTFRDGESPTGSYAGTADVSLTNETFAGFRPDASYDGTSVGMDGYPTDFSGLLRFDVSALTPGTRIERVQLSYNVNNTTAGAYSGYECLRPWSESEATWLQASVATPWAVQGARGLGTDRGADVVVRLRGAAFGAMTVQFEDAGVAMVQRWVDAPAANFGLVLEESWTTDSLLFDSSEATNAANRPSLELTYDGGQVARFQNGVAPTAAYGGTQDTIIGTGVGVTSLDQEGLWSSPQTSALLRFDVAGVPAGARVLSAELLLTCALRSQLRTVRAALAPWTEAANWTTRDAVTPWGAPGAMSEGVDHSAAVLASIPAGLLGELSVPLTDAGVELLQQWIDGSAANHGFFLPTGGAIAFHDSESSVTSARPALRIVYEDGTDGGEPDGGDAGEDGTDGGDAGVSAEPVHLVVSCACRSAGGAGWPALLAVLGLFLLPRAVTPAARSRGRR